MIKPQALDAERALIHCILNNHELIYELKTPLKPSVFFGLDNALVVKYFNELVVCGKTPDEVLIRSTLTNAGQFDAIGGDAYFNQINNIDYLTANLNEYAGMILDTFVRREVIDVGKKISDAGYAVSATEAVGLALTETNNLLETANFGEETSLVSELMANEFDAFLERMKTPGMAGMPTGFAEYDLYTGGLSKTDEVIIAARPSTGKTALALRLLLNLAKQGLPGVMFSYEMSQQQLMQRFLSMESGIDLGRIRSGLVAPGEEYDRVASAANLVNALPISISNNLSASVADVVTETRKMIRSRGVEVVVVDFVQLMPHRMELATQDLGHIARQLKTLAMDSNIVVILLSQLNRLVEMRTKKIPILSDLRQSGNLEEYADLVLMLYREEMYEPTETNRGEARLLIRKNRNGAIGSLPIRFNAPTVDFKEI